MVDQLYTNARTDTYKHPSRYVRAAVGIGRGARSGWVGAEQRALTSGVGAPLFGKIDTYGWDGARLIQWESYVWLGRPVESKPPPEGCTL